MAIYKLKTFPIDTDETSYTLGPWVHDVPDPVDGYALVWRQDYNVAYVLGTGNGIAARVTNDDNLRDKLPLGVGLGLVPPTDTIFFSTPQFAKPIVPGTFIITATAVDGTVMTVRDIPINIPENRGDITGDVEPSPRNMLKKDGVNLFQQNTINYNLATFFFQFRKQLNPNTPINVSYKTSGLVFEECCERTSYSFHGGTGTRITDEAGETEDDREITVTVELDDIIGTEEGLVSRDSDGAYGTTPALSIDSTVTGTAITIDSTRRIGIGTTAPRSSLDVVGTIRISQDHADPTASGSIVYDDTGNTSLTFVNEYNSDDATFGIRMKGATAADEVLTILGDGRVGIGTTTPTTQFEVAGDITVGTDANGNYGSLNLNGVTISDFDTEVVRVLSASSIAVTPSGNVELTNAIRIRDTNDASPGNIRFNIQESRVEAYTGNNWIEVARDEHQGRTSATRTPGQAIPVATVDANNSPYDIDQDDGLIICNGATSIQLNLPDPADYTATWFQIKDKSGNLSAQNTVTISPPSGILLDKSQNPHVIDISLTAVGVISTGSEWLVF